MFRLEPSDVAIEAQVVADSYALMVNVLSDGYPSGAEFLSKTARARLVTMQECVETAFVAVGVRRGLPILAAANRVLSRLQVSIGWS